MSPEVQRRLRLFRNCILAWTVIGLFFFSQGLAQKVASRDPTPWFHYLISWLVGCEMWALITPFILWLSRRIPIERTKWLRRTALHLFLAVTISLVQIAIEAAILTRLGVFPTVMKSFPETMAVLMILGFHQGILTYWIVLALHFGLLYYRQYQERSQQALRLELHAAELKTQLVRAHLGALKMQLQPHFLFNTLNAIMVLVRQQRSGEAEETIGRLSDLLRFVLEDVDSQEVPLERELQYLQLYLSIEQVRFRDRMQVEIAADPSVLDAAIPHMGLQPLVENAIRHGIGKRSAAGRIRISAVGVDGKLEIKVSDDGPGLPPAGVPAGRGIGLSNTRARLHQLYGDAAKLEIENGEQGGAVATMVLPYRAAPGAIGMTDAGMMEVHAIDSFDRG